MLDARHSVLIENREIGAIREPPLRNPFVGESAWPIKHQHHVYIRHYLLLVNSCRALMPSMAFGGGLTGLAEGAATEGRENQNKQNHSENCIQ